MKNQSNNSRHEIIAKTFQDLGLDDPKLRRRLQDFSESEVLIRQVKRREGVLATRNNTAPMMDKLRISDGVKLLGQPS